MADTSEIEFVPAAPGFDVLTFLPDDKTFDARPVIAWAILRADDGTVRAWPVSVSESWSVNDDRPVRLPDGQVVCGDMEWPTDAEWLAHAVKGTFAISPQKAAPVLALDAFRGKLREG